MSSDPDHELVIDAVRAVCPASGLDGPARISIRGQRIAKVGSHRSADESVPWGTVSFYSGMVTAGLIDLHAHPANQDSVFGVDPDAHMLTHGVTTVVSQGDAGADHVADYTENTIKRSRCRVVLAINLSRVGESTSQGCFQDLAYADVDACLAAIQSNACSIWGIAVNPSHHACPTADPREILRRGLLVAKEAGLPLLYGMRRPEDWPLAEQLEMLRAGDVVTYCYRSQPHCIVEAGRVLPEVRNARANGVLFDAGHGRASFDFRVAEQAIADAFPPDTISTDLQAGHVSGDSNHGLPLVMSMPFG